MSKLQRTKLFSRSEPRFRRLEAGASAGRLQQQDDRRKPLSHHY
ncbi:MAG: hypothetical protein R6V86_00950 [Spirochaetia bacterium]